jgi:hypothetical protein
MLFCFLVAHILSVRIECGGSPLARMIGKNGVVIKELQLQSGAFINMSKASSAPFVYVGAFISITLNLSLSLSLYLSQSLSEAKTGLATRSGFLMHVLSKPDSRCGF